MINPVEAREASLEAKTTLKTQVPTPGKVETIAGFNEIGESIEDTVRREVLEEAGVHVKNLRFYKSQPWVFTDTLLMGFFCELDGSDKITMQESELSEAGWFHRSTLPEDYSHISLTGEMIDQFRLGNF